MSELHLLGVFLLFLFHRLLRMYTTALRSLIEIDFATMIAHKIQIVKAPATMW